MIFFEKPFSLQTFLSSLMRRRMGTTTPTWLPWDVHQQRCLWRWTALAAAYSHEAVSCFSKACGEGVLPWLLAKKQVPSDARRRDHGHSAPSSAELCTAGTGRAALCSLSPPRTGSCWWDTMHSQQEQGISSQETLTRIKASAFSTSSMENFNWS